jgi:haloacetate dehalogenase
MFQGFRHERIEVGDVAINARVGGSGPPVLLLHGFPQTHALWARVAPVIAARYTVVAADLRGYGASGKPEALPDASNYSFRTMAADMLGLMAALGFERFHLVGHDRGGRTAHRLALDHAHAVVSLAVLDIVPTYAMLIDANRHVAGAYWHWYFLSQSAAFTERLIGFDPDFFFETCLLGWGATRVEDFDTDQLAAYRAAWRDPDTIRGMCADYRAAIGPDLAHDTADIDVKLALPVLAFWGANGVMAGLFDMEAEWRKRCTSLETASLPGGHFFIDQFPGETADRLLQFLDRHV